MSLKELYYKVAAKHLAKPQGLIGRYAMYSVCKNNKSQYDFIVNELEGTNNLNVLDVGFGNGVLLNTLANKYPNNYYGIDISKDMVKLASKINKNHKIELKLGNIKDIPFDDNLFDVIYTSNTVYFWQDTKKAISEVKRVLKPNGKFINTLFSKEALDNLPHANYGYNKYTVDELLDIMNSIGETKAIEIEKGRLAIIARKEKL